MVECELIRSTDLWPEWHDCPPQPALQSTSMSPTDDPEVFIDDDDGFLAWLSDHARGYVLNAARKPTASYLMLHRTDCSTIGNVPANGLAWTSDLLKACSDDRLIIEQWARAETGGVPSLCGRCQP
jgi:hypothetical protein